MKPGRSVLTAEQQREVVRLYVEEEESAPAIGRRMYCAERTVRRVLEAHGVPRRFSSTPEPVSQDSIDRAVELYLSGCSMKEAGQIMGVNGSTIRKRLHLAGVTTRDRPQSAALTYRARLAQGGLNVRQRAALKFVEEDVFDDHPTTTSRVARAIGTTTRYARRTLLQLENYGLVKSKRDNRYFIWKRTKLPVRDVLEHTLAGEPTRRAGEVWLPIEPLRDWLEQLIGTEQRLMLHIPTGEGEGIAPTPGAARVATRLGIDDRRLYALRFVQASVTLSMADQCLLWGDGTTLEDLWPELGSDEEVARLPRSYQQRDRQLEAAA